MKWELREIAPGDMVRVPMGELYHYGVCTGNDRIIEFGRPVLSSPLPKEEIRVGAVTIGEFLGDSFGEVAVPDKRERKRLRPVSEIISYAESSVGKGGYDILYNNCEHFANECLFGKAESRTIEDARREIESKMPLITVYVGETEYFSKNRILPKYAKAQLKAITNESVIAEKRAGFGLLSLILKDTGRKADIKKCTRSSTGKPIHPDFCFSVSHSGGLVAAAISNAPVGIDLEVRGDSISEERVMEKILSGDESRDTDPLLLWTRKEAIFKRSGTEAVFRPGRIDSSKAPTKSVSFTYGGKSYILTVSADVLLNLRINNITSEETAFTEI